MLKSPLQILLQTSVDYALQLSRQILADLSNGSWIFAQYRSQNRHSGVTVKCFLSSDHLIEHRTKAEDVRPCIDLSALGLLRRHVRSRSQNGPFLCLRTCARGKSLRIIVVSA